MCEYARVYVLLAVTFSVGGPKNGTNHYSIGRFYGQYNQQVSPSKWAIPIGLLPFKWLLYSLKTDNGKINIKLTVCNCVWLLQSNFVVASYYSSEGGRTF